MNTRSHTEVRPLPSPSDWSFALIGQYHQEIARVAADYGLDTFPNQIELITAEQMMDAYAAVGMPVNYHHWSFGKHFLSTEKRYRRGQMGLAYEIVINSNPCIAYLMEENSMTMQALVIAHACYGHNSFFKRNYLFQKWTNPDSIIDYLLFARNYIAECEERYGQEAVEEVLDACHSLMNYGVDRYKHPPKLSVEKEKARQRERADHMQKHVNILWSTLPVREAGAEKKASAERFHPQPEENILYFIEKNAPLLLPWEREIVRIVRKIAQYFYPQRQTQVMNEGWACFWHYTIINTLYDEGFLSEQFMLEFLEHHTNVTLQLPYNDRRYSGLNPYALGFAMWMDIKRICEGGVWLGGTFVPSTDELLKEDRTVFPDIAGTDWRTTFDFAMRNFKDESFIAQYLSPYLISKLRLFSILDDSRNTRLYVDAIHDEAGFTRVRKDLSDTYNLGNHEPNIQVFEVNRRGDRSLTLLYTRHQGRTLNEDELRAVLNHLALLWGFTVRIETHLSQGEIILIAAASPPQRQKGD